MIPTGQTRLSKTGWISHLCSIYFVFLKGYHHLRLYVALLTYLLHYYKVRSWSIVITS